MHGARRGVAGGPRLDLDARGWENPAPMTASNRAAPLALGPRVRVDRLATSDEAAFLGAVAASVALHGSWVSPPKTPEAFQALVARAGPTFEALAIRQHEGRPRSDAGDPSAPSGVGDPMRAPVLKVALALAAALLLPASVRAAGPVPADGCPTATKPGHWTRIPPMPGRSPRPARVTGEPTQPPWRTVFALGRLYVFTAGHHGLAFDPCRGAWAPFPSPTTPAPPAHATPDPDPALDAETALAPTVYWHLVPEFRRFAGTRGHPLQVFDGAVVKLHRRRVHLAAAGAPAPRAPRSYVLAAAGDRVNRLGRAHRLRADQPRRGLRREHPAVEAHGHRGRPVPARVGEGGLVDRARLVVWGGLDAAGARTTAPPTTRSGTAGAPSRCRRPDHPDGPGRRRGLRPPPRRPPGARRRPGDRGCLRSGDEPLAAGGAAPGDMAGVRDADPPRRPPAPGVRRRPEPAPRGPGPGDRAVDRGALRRRPPLPADDAGDPLDRGAPGGLRGRPSEAHEPRRRLRGTKAPWHGLRPGAAHLRPRRPPRRGDPPPAASGAAGEGYGCTWLSS